LAPPLIVPGGERQGEEYRERGEERQCELVARRQRQRAPLLGDPVQQEARAAIGKPRRRSKNEHGEDSAHAVTRSRPALASNDLASGYDSARAFWGRVM